MSNISLTSQSWSVEDNDVSYANCFTTALPMQKEIYTENNPMVITCSKIHVFMYKPYVKL